MIELREPYDVSADAVRELHSDLVAPEKEIDVEKQMLAAWNAKLKREAEEEEAAQIQLRSEKAMQKLIDDQRKMLQLYNEAAGFH